MVFLQSVFGEDAAIFQDTNFQLMLLATVLPVFGISVLSPILDSLIGPFGASPATIGLIIAFYTAPQIVFIPISGVLADKYGRKPVLVSGLILFGTAGGAITFTTDFSIVLVLRFIQGVGVGGINPIIITSIGDMYTGSREAAGQGFRFMMSGLSGTLFPLLAGGLVVFAWQYPFLLYGIAFPVAALVYLWFEEPTTNHVSDGGTSRSYVRALLELLGERRVFVLVVARMMPTAVWIGYLTYISIIVVRLVGGSPPLVGVIVAIGSFIRSIGASQAGRITDASENRFYPLIGANICLSVGFGVILLSPGLVSVTMGVALTGAGFGVLLSLYRSIVTGLAPESLRAGLVSIAEAGGRGVSTLTPVVMGGIIAIASPLVGFASAVQVAGLSIAIIGGGGGILCLIIANASSPHHTREHVAFDD